MSTNVSKIAKLAKKGAPPKAEASLDVIRANTRADSGQTVPLQFKVSAAEFEDFSELAAKEFGHKKGAKTDLFRKMFEAYKSTA